ncbi:MAG: sulfatase-like hydrolase/transferase [Phycisphaerales bacterium]|nr:sulfatase-like hydrolase/transferase [Phycisphaerales bacterium]
MINVPPFLDDNPETRRDLASFYGAIRVADTAIGRILDVLDRTGLRENTWVIFTTDHGMAFPGAKSTLYDPGIGVACIMRWPKGFTGSRHLDSLFSHVDLVPTILNALGIDAPENIQGASAWNALASPYSEPHRQFLFAERTHHGTHYDPMRCVRTQRHKLIRNFQPGSPPPIPGDVQSGGSAIHLTERLLTARPAIELYDLDTDPWEKNNLAGSTACEQIRQKLTDELNQWMHLTDDPLLKGPIPLPNAVTEAQHIIKQ